MIKRITFVCHDLNVMFSLLFWAYLLFIIITNDRMQIDWLKTCRLHVYYKRRMCKEKTIKRAGKICRGIFIINSYRLKRGGKRIGCDIHTALLRTHAHFCFYFKGGYIYIYIFPSFCLFSSWVPLVKKRAWHAKSSSYTWLCRLSHTIRSGSPLKIHGEIRNTRHEGKWM